MIKHAASEAFPFAREDIRPTALAIIAAGALQERAPKRHERWAIRSLGEMASKSFVTEPIEAVDIELVGKLHRQATYWHGTGRYQRRRGEQVDVLRAIMRGGAINPFDPKLGLTERISLTSQRLYARAYADMHSDRPEQLRRFVRAQDAANFYVVRPTIRHIIRTARERGHDEGFLGGLQPIREAVHKRRPKVPQPWRDKVTSRPVDTMFAFGAGSDIPGNYPALFGIDADINPIATSIAIRETREVQVADSITLGHVTHVEVPEDKIDEVSILLSENGWSTPVIAIEHMEQYVSGRPVEETFLGRLVMSV